MSESQAFGATQSLHCEPKTTKSKIHERIESGDLPDLAIYARPAPEDTEHTEIAVGIGVNPEPTGTSPMKLYAGIAHALFSLVSGTIESAKLEGRDISIQDDLGREIGIALSFIESSLSDQFEEEYPAAYAAYRASLKERMGGDLMKLLLDGMDPAGEA